MVELWQADAVREVPELRSRISADSAGVADSRLRTLPTGSRRSCQFQTIQPGVAGRTARGGACQRLSLHARSAAAPLHAYLFRRRSGARERSGPAARPVGTPATLLAQPSPSVPGRWAFEIRLQGTTRPSFSISEATHEIAGLIEASRRPKRSPRSSRTTPCCRPCSTSRARSRGSRAGSGVIPARRRARSSRRPRAGGRTIDAAAVAREARASGTPDSAGRKALRERVRALDPASRVVRPLGRDQPGHHRHRDGPAAVKRARAAIAADHERGSSVRCARCRIATPRR